MEISKKTLILVPGLTGLTFLGIYAIAAVLGYQVIRQAPCGFAGFFMMYDFLPDFFDKLQNPLILFFALPGIIFFIFGALVGFLRQKVFVTGKKILSRAILLAGIISAIVAIAFLLLPICD